MAEARDIILRPIVTEQTMADMDNKKYTFEVARDAEKTAVRRAVEEIFDVQVAKVNIANVRGKKEASRELCGLHPQASEGRCDPDR